jgi:hypothetical protein
MFSMAAGRAVFLALDSSVLEHVASPETSQVNRILPNPIAAGVRSSELEDGPRGNTQISHYMVSSFKVGRPCREGGIR